MEFCCDNFKWRYYIENNYGLNIRVVKFTSDFLINDEMSQSKTKKLFDLKFYMTMGYNKFVIDLPMASIYYCPFCGIKLRKFYNESYANEIEGMTFTL